MKIVISLIAASFLAAAAQAADPVVVGRKAQQLHQRSLIFDGHNDLPWQYRELVAGDLDAIDIAQPQPQLHTDLARLKAGNVGAQFWSIYAPAESEHALQEALIQIDLVRRMVDRYEELEWATSSEDIARARRNGRIASLLGLEGGHMIENSIPVLRELYALGVRYMTLTHANTLDWVDAATDEPRNDGLSEFGEEVVRTMNELGMLVDISHVSVATMDDVLRVSKAPVIASHSCAYGVAAHPRNVPDDILVRLRDNGGVVMVNFASGFVVPEAAAKSLDWFDVRREMREQYPSDDEFRAAWEKFVEENPLPSGSIHDLIDHIDHIVAVAGIDHVGLGSDFDGVSLLPEQLEDVSTYPNITQALLDRGYSAKDVQKVLGENALRALREAEQVAREFGD